MAEELIMSKLFALLLQMNSNKKGEYFFSLPNLRGILGLFFI
jgi:hypothetical protein